jgi:hypothetical protein
MLGRTMGTRPAHLLALLALALVLVLPSGAAAAGDRNLDLEPHLPLLYGPALGVFNLYWDTNWAQSSRDDVDAATRALIESEYFAGARQYGVPGIYWAGSAVAFPACGSLPSPIVNTLAIKSFVQCEEASAPDVPRAGGIPTPIFDSWGNSTGTVIYNVILPAGVRAEIVPGVPSTITCSPGGPGAYHYITSSLLRLGRLGGRPLYFTVDPFECADSDVKRLIALISHEDVEAMTDPTPLLHWWDEFSGIPPPSTDPAPNPLDRLQQLVNALLGKAEASDICETFGDFQDLPYRANGILLHVSTYWSNDQNACVASLFRVVETTFAVAQPGPPRAEVTVEPPGGDPLVASPSATQAVLDGTVFAFESPIAVTADERWQRSLDESSECGGLVLFPADDPGTATAQTTKTCHYVHQYRAHFDETGLPAGTSWSVTVNGTTHTGPIDVWLDDGKPVSFSFADADGFTVQTTDPATGVVVSGPLTVTATYVYVPKATYRDVVLADHPVGYWRLDEGSGTTVFDSADGADGTYVNGVSLGVPGAILSEPDTAAAFDGVDDHADIPNTPALDITHPGLSVELWAKGPPQRLYATLLNKSDFNGTMGYSIYAGATGRLRFWIGGPFRFTADFPFTWDNRWHHIVGVYDGLALRLYVDKVEEVATPASGPIGDSAAKPLRLGDFTGGGFPFAGALDEVAVYDYALSNDQVHHHYNQAIFGSIYG